MIFRKTAFTLTLLVLSVAAFAQSTIVDSFRIGNAWRSYRLYIPANYTAGGSRPLIINMHGLSSTAFEQQEYSRFMPIADTAGFLVVHPQGFPLVVLLTGTLASPLHQIPMM